MVSATRLARLARQALIAEAELTPKPGLVDRRGAGAHTDLSLTSMRRSAAAIEPYFREMALISRAASPTQSLREQLAVIGRDAECAMFVATGGSNSHKGAIWVLGLLVSGAAMSDGESASASEIAAIAQQIASFSDRAAPRPVTHGDWVAKRYGVDGARGEARSGFPHLVNVGLPALRDRRARGVAERVARLDALLTIMSRLDDTCLLFRGGEAALLAAKKGAAAVEIAGGCGTEVGRERLASLDQRLLEMRVSPGGSADLFAATLFLDAVSRGVDQVQPDESEAEEINGAH
jgi:triphosphoribosyl-dephospho-CoA synthase